MKSPDRLAAQAEVTRLNKEFQAAKSRLNAAEAALLRVHLGDLFTENPWVKEVSWEHEAVYDDEGGYDDIANVSVGYDEDSAPEDVDMLEDELRDELGVYSCEAWGIVCGEGEYEGSVDRDKLAETSG